MEPLPVEIINHTDWWQPYVPPLVGFLGSVLVALVALYSIRKSTKTSEKAITSADTREREKWQTDSEREREKWHRDNLLRICSEALSVARDIQTNYTDAAAACATNSDLVEAQNIYRQHMNAVEDAINKVVPLSYEIELLGETTVAFEFLEFRETAVFIEPAVEQFHDYLVANFDRIRSGEGPGEPLMQDELRETLEWRRYYKASVHIQTAIRDFLLVAQRKISPQSVPENAPARMTPVITPDEHPDLFYAGAGRRNSIFMRSSPFDWNAGDTADPPHSPPTS